jgi:hypothetical protein
VPCDSAALKLLLPESWEAESLVDFVCFELEGSAAENDGS